MKILSPSLPLHSSFLLPSQLSRRIFRGKACYAGYSDFTAFLANENVEDECTKQFLKTVFDYKWSCY